MDKLLALRHCPVIETVGLENLLTLEQGQGIGQEALYQSPAGR